MIAGIFEYPGALLAWLYSLTHSYAASIGIIAFLVMAIVTPLILKSTRGMLEMQRIAPEMRALQSKYRDDRAMLQAEMMKLYQEHNVNPMASCFPLVAQMPVFFIMFRILQGLIWTPVDGQAVLAHAVLTAGGESPGSSVGFFPRYIDHGSELYQSLVHKTEMNSLGLDLSRSAAEMLGENFGRGLIYAGLVVFLGLLYLVQQRMVAARAAVNPTMSPTQQKLMQYLPVFFAVFQIFFLLGLVWYYIVQTILRILQQAYITRRFYGDEESLGRQAQAASERARELAQKDGGGGGLFGQARQELADSRKKAEDRVAKQDAKQPTRPANSKRTTAPKGRPTPKSGSTARSRPKSSKNRRRKNS